MGNFEWNLKNAPFRYFSFINLEHRCDSTALTNTLYWKAPTSERQFRLTPALSTYNRFPIGSLAEEQEWKPRDTDV